MSLALWKSPRLKFQIGREAHANVGSCVSAYSCDHGSHGRLWCACFSSKGALCVRCMAEIGPCRELPPSPDAPRWRPSVYFSVSSHRGRINEPGVEDAGEREGNINGVAARSGRPLTLGVTSPGEGRIETGGVHHAQHRLLYFEVMPLEINWRCALRYPLASWHGPREGSSSAQQVRLRVADAPRCSLR